MTGDLRIVTFGEFRREIEAGERVLIDIDTVPFRIRTDYNCRNQNIKAGRELCERCDGTGNEFFSMYRRCSECLGRGHNEQPKSS